MKSPFPATLGASAEPTTLETPQHGVPPVSRRVVIGVDLSEDSREAAEWAAGWAHEEGAALHLIMTETMPARAQVLAPELRKQLDDDLAAEAARIAALHPQLSVTYEALISPPAAALVAASEHANLVVVGARGVGGWSGLLLGSVSATVTAHASCPVVVVPRAPQAPAGAPVILGADGSPESAEAAEHAFAYAAKTGAPLVVVHAWSLPATVGITVLPGPVDSSDLAAETEDLLRATVGSCARDYPDVQVEYVTAPGPAAAVLAEHTDAARLLVLGSRGLGGFRGLLLGSVSREVIQRASCPVMVVRGSADIEDES